MRQAVRRTGAKLPFWPPIVSAPMDYSLWDIRTRTSPAYDSRVFSLREVARYRAPKKPMGVEWQYFSNRQLNGADPRLIGVANGVERGSWLWIVQPRQEQT